MKIKYIPFTIFFLFIFSSCEIKKDDLRPNFIIFIADDISWDDIGAYGNEFVNTPNIDNLAKEGLIFNNMYLTKTNIIN